MFLDGLVAEPPVHLLSTDESLNLILGVGMEDAAGDPARQYRQDLVVVAQIRHHSQRSRIDHFERIVEGENGPVEGLSRALEGMRAIAQQTFAEPFPAYGADKLDGMNFSPFPFFWVLAEGGTELF